MNPTALAARRADSGIDARLLSWAALPFSLEALFVLFVFAGCYKGDPRWEGLSFDLTALFFVLSGAAALGVMLRPGFTVRSRSLPLTAAFAAFVLFCLASLAWTPGSYYAGEKAKLLGVLTTWSFAAGGLFIAGSRRRVERLLLVIVLFSVWIAAESLLASRGDHSSGDEVLGASYLMLGRTLGAAAVIVLGYAVAIAPRGPLRFAALALCGVFLLALLLLGGRMPLLAAAAGMSVPLLVQLRVRWRAGGARRNRAWLPLLVLAAGAVGGVVWFGGEELPRTLERFTLLLEGDLGRSGSSRVEYLRAAWDYWLAAPVAGNGLGSWPILFLSEDSRHYPHNLFVEAAVECGAIGLVLLAAVHIFSFRALGSAEAIRRDPLRLIVLMLWVNTLANAMVSGDFPDNRFHFSVLGLTLLPFAPQAEEEQA